MSTVLLTATIYAQESSVIDGSKCLAIADEPCRRVRVNAPKFRVNLFQKPEVFFSREQRSMHVVTHGPHFGTGFVAGLPFSANFFSEHEVGGTQTGFLARDSRGREHRRIDLAPGLSVTVIADPVAEKIYMINSGSGIVSETPWPYPPGEQIPNGFPDDPPDAERREVEGFVCFRRELSPPVPAPLGVSAPVWVSGPAWVSPRIGLVAEEFVTAEGDHGSWRLHDIDLAEPDPQLFEAPRGILSP